jgi:VCBS repeat-containing protein
MELLTGTSGHDSLNVSSASAAYEIRGLAGHDVIYGSGFADLIVAGAGADQSFGNAGDDIFLIDVTDTFADSVNGGAGFDTIRGGAGNDVLLLLSIASIERIEAGGGADVLRGTDNPNYWTFTLTTLFGITEIDGRGGNDQITGSAGDDRIIGGGGNDTLDGGVGNDTAVYIGNFAAYTLTALTSGQLRIATAANSDGTDTVRGFETIEFADGTYSNGAFTPFGDPGNTIPVAMADLFATTEDVALSVNAASGVLANDADDDADVLAVSAFDASSARGGSVTMSANGSFTYTPASNVHGTDTFGYTVSDGRGGQASATVTITLAAVNDVPVAADNTYSALKDTALVVNTGAGVLANDTDPDGTALSISAFDASSVRGGRVAMNADGSFTYTPPTGFVGTDSFSYTASDGTLQDAAKVTLSVSSSSVPTFDSLISGLAENEWVRLNSNEFEDVWTPTNQRPYEYIGGTPKSIILAWGSATWDSNRGEYIIWGGGHANYEGNEVYTWSSQSLLWERASLPSAIKQISGARYEAVDGYENAPISSHAYDNLEFLELSDRMVNFGGAAAHTGSGFVATDGSKTGPYFWDPSKADPDSVGGTTGSHVNPILFPDVAGGEMWENRNNWSASAQMGSMVSGTTDYAQIDGRDVVFVNTYNRGLFKYTVNEVEDASLDTWELVGITWDTFSGDGAGAYDSSRNIYVRTSVTEFTFWDLDSAGPTNRNVSFVPSDPSGEFELSKKWGMEYDPIRERFVLWEGDASVWFLEPPDTPGANGWILEKAPEPTLATPQPPADLRGVLGKWDYVASHDVFIGVTDQLTGDIWAYKPEGWTPTDWLV